MAFCFFSLFSCKGFKGLTVNEFDMMLSQDRTVQLLDVRTPEEFAENHLPGAINIDFYSGFVYDLIGIPREIYTALFAMARIVGWCAHRNEELNFEGRRIIRPAYRCVTDERNYIALGERRDIK